MCAAVCTHDADPTTQNTQPERAQQQHPSPRVRHVYVYVSYLHTYDHVLVRVQPHAPSRQDLCAMGMSATLQLMKEMTGKDGAEVLFINSFIEWFSRADEDENGGDDGDGGNDGEGTAADASPADASPAGASPAEAASTAP